MLYNSPDESCGAFFFLPMLLHTLKKIAVIILYHVESKSRHIDEIGRLFDLVDRLKIESLNIANWRP